MSFSKLRFCAPAACAAVLLASCSGSGTAPGAPPIASQRPSAESPRGASWMRPEAKHDNLLYVSEYGGGVVDVFSFPRGKQVGLLTGFVNPQGECVDSKSDVFIVNASINFGQPSILEFAHGGTAPLETLSDPNQEPYSCAIDSKSGTLAVANESAKIALYVNAQGNPSYLFDGNMALMLWAGYDNQGNLFVDGLNNKVNPELDELPSGKTSFRKLTLNQTIGFPGYIQWDGKHITMEDALYQGNDTSAIYRLQILGSNAQIVGTTVLGGSLEVFQGWIAGRRVIGAEEGPGTDAVDYWRYPASGNSTKSLSKSSGFFNGVFGAAVSP